MRTPFPLSKRETSVYDATIRKIRSHHGSYDAIATKYFSATGIRITGQTVRTWFLDRSLPVPQAAILVSLTPDARLAALFPWLSSYTGDN
jgi:hypothetical protein